MPAQQKNFNNKNIKALLVLFLLCFVLFFFFAVVGVFVVLQSCKNMAGKNCTRKYERSIIIRIEAFIELKAKGTRAE